MRSTILLALGLISAYPSIAAPRAIHLREECTRDRCVYYHGSERVVSVEKEYGTKRLVVRNGDRDVIGKITRNGDGTITVKESGKRR